MKDWKLAEWHKFFKQTSTISKYWTYWKDVADSSPEFFLEKDEIWFSKRNETGGDSIYNEIKKVIYFLKENTIFFVTYCFFFLNSFEKVIAAPCFSF